MNAVRRTLALAAAAALAACAGCAGSGPGPGAHAEVGRDTAVQTGLASYYASRYHGRPTASGEIYDENALTAAHRNLPFGTRIRVTRLDDGRAVTLRVNDRGPFVAGRVVDVSRRAARELDFVAAGLVPVRLQVLE
ncbi:MAG: septal ring lytic transglycosylase RlpA family protein [Krumholzibacteria bacterium]|nr:septal ring lytic transglycosylase RlpA family protein [Candidatus Krumholzibacteria bacterium]